MEVKKLACFIVVCVLGAAALAEEIDYGADEVNAMQERRDMVKGGKSDYNYLALKNHKGPSGVPLGGIGTGCFDIAPNGAFTRIALNNTHEAGVLKDVQGSFLAFWNGEDAKLLQRKSVAGMDTIDNVTYTGLFPTIKCDYGNGVTLNAYSGLIPHNIKDSSLPVAWLDVTVKNTTGKDSDFSVAFSWEDVIARGISDYADPSIFNQVSNNAWSLNTVKDKHPEKGLQPMEKPQTRVVPLEVGSFSGLLQYSKKLKPSKMTYQNYNNKTAILAENSSGVKVSFLPEWKVDNPKAWKSFVKSGEFEPDMSQPLSSHGEGAAASAVSIKTHLKAGESKTVRFMLAWFAPEYKIDREKADPVTYFGSADYCRYYHNYFDNIKELVSYAAKNRSRILNKSREWHKPVLDSTMPDWLKFKLINSGYVIYTNSILNKAGDFTVMEGMMGGLAGTMDQRMSSHPFFQKFFTEIDRSEMELFGHTPGSMGQILHFDGHYYIGIASRDGQTPTPEGWMLDNSGSWLVQLAKEYQQTGDLEYIAQFRDEIKGAVAFLKERMLYDLEIPVGYTTYDDFWHPDIYSYTATTYPVFMDAAAVLFEALGENQLAQECRYQKERSVQDAVNYLWNGKYFAYGCDPDGTNRLDDVMFSGQLAGQFVSRYCQWNENFPVEMVKSSIIAQLKTNVGNSVDYYAPKVWDIPAKQAEQGDYGKSTCWPFYLESYTAMAAMQAGFLQDGLDIMKHIQLVHLRNGWTWTQNLWQPDEVTYMTAPVTWFVTDVLAGAGVDVTKNTLYLAPVSMEKQGKVQLPLFYPKFWAVVTLDNNNKTASLKVTKTFGEEKYKIDRLICRPVGKSFAQQKTFDISPVTLKAGKTIDLSEYYNAITDAEIHEPILDKIEVVPFKEYTPAKSLKYPEIKSAQDFFIDSIEVSIASEKGDIYYTLDGSDPKAEGKKYTKPFKVDTETTVLAVASSDGLYSPVQSKTFTKAEPLSPDLENPVRFRYQLYKGYFQKLPDFAFLEPVKSGIAVDSNVKRFRFKDNFAVLYEGSVTIEKDGVYTFSLRSDDGSRLTVGGKVLSNDGVHDATDTKTMTVPLSKGIYSVKVEYFENEGGELLEVKWQPSGSDSKEVSLF
ncbi:putative bile acid beta-glucosidase [Sedimentisphaera cyanobacteriorum]|uniref:Putative bile acid beta-glucosidase n=1 Tax=Sedimentisphaera cyanobacteriorum TaxID=1940790 RepID=A0A1Q2HS66_9BACT|nr:GH116 family glycosyl-hydrolase [Sedimentisphaera cyanobacteriorum]AQQ10297.1 putative bile acid beta-glucosidase [Sedimentisphaera cyanobacteriorum]